MQCIHSEFVQLVIQHYTWALRAQHTLQLSPTTSELQISRLTLNSVWPNHNKKKFELMLMKRATASVKFHTQVVLVYPQ